MQNKQELNNINEIIQKTTEGLGYEYILSETVYTKNNVLIKVYIDSHKSEKITLDDCVSVTRQLNRVIAVEFPEDDSKYRLEVSSPGLDRPLVTIDHYKKFIGKLVKIKLHVPLVSNENTTQKNINGYIQDIIDNSDNNIKIVCIIDKDDKNKIYELDFSNIAKGNLVPEWDKIVKEKK